MRALKVLFLTSSPSLCSSTAPQSTLLLLLSSSSWFLCSLFCTLVLLQYLCTSVSAAVFDQTHPEICLWPKVESLSSVSQGILQLLWVALYFRLFTRVSISLSRMHKAADFLPTLAWNTSAVFGSFSFSEICWRRVHSPGYSRLSDTQFSVNWVSVKFNSTTVQDCQVQVG